MNSTYIYIFIILLFYYFIYLYNRKIPIEHFEDRINNDPNYNDPYDKEFVDLYENIYRDLFDANADFNIIKEKTLTNPVQDEINILIAGSGVGKLASIFKKKFKNITGVDKSENMIRKSYELYPHIKFIKGDLLNKELFEKNTFTHIIFDNYALNYNNEKDRNIIIKNCNNWLKYNGFLIVPIFEQEKMTISPRHYSTSYIDNKGVLHSYTYLNGFAHDGYLIQDDASGKENVLYFDKIILEDGQHRIKKTQLYIPKKEDMYENIMKDGFIITYNGIDIKHKLDHYNLVIFKKEKKFMNVNEIQEKYKS